MARRVSPFTNERGIAASWTCLWSIRKSSGKSMTLLSHVRQQVERDTPRIITCLKTNAAYRDVDLHPDVAEFLQRYIGDKPGLLFATRNGTPHLPQQHRRSLANGTAQGDGIRRARYGLACFPSFPQNVAAW